MKSTARKPAQSMLQCSDRSLQPSSEGLRLLAAAHDQRLAQANGHFPAIRPSLAIVASSPRPAWAAPALRTPAPATQCPAQRAVTVRRQNGGLRGKPARDNPGPEPPRVGEALPQSGASGQGKDIEKRRDQPISKRREEGDDAMALCFAPPPSRQQLPRHGDRHVIAVVCCSGRRGSPGRQRR